LVLKHARESVELDDLAERVERLERGSAPPMSGKPSASAEDEE
jgi:hypothetical protein